MADLVPVEPTEKVLARHEPASLPGQMARHHPIHGLFGAVFEKVGGFARLAVWADENYTDFVRVFARMAPPPSADVTVRQMNIQINSEIKETALDVEPDAD